GSDVAAHEGERARALDSLRAWNRRWARAAALADFSDLRVARDGRFFEAADSKHVDITQRDALRRLVIALVEARLERAGEPVPIASLIGIGWPGEHVPYQAGWARLRAAIKMLRALGLRELIITRNGGYLLDETASVEWAGC